MKYKLIGLYIVFFIIIFLIDNFVVINRIYSDHKQPYRLGDVVNIYNISEDNIPLYSKKKYKYSIASEYLNKDKDKEYKFNIDLLNNIVKKRTKIRHKLYDNYINIHLRTGDIMNNNNVDNYINKNIKSYNGYNYVKPLSYYDKVLKYLKKNNINNKNVLIVSGWHTILSDNNKNNSEKYIDKIKKLFEKNRYNVTTRLNEDPDEDFLIMSNSKYFVQSGGGYSKIIGKIVEYNGNTLINKKTIQ